MAKAPIAVLAYDSAPYRNRPAAVSQTGAKRPTQFDRSARIALTYPHDDPEVHEDSRTLLAQARAELTQHDVRQASEKGWGAAAQMLKAVAPNARAGNTVSTGTCPALPAGSGRKPATGTSTPGTRWPMLYTATSMRTKWNRPMLASL